MYIYIDSQWAYIAIIYKHNEQKYISLIFTKKLKHNKLSSPFITKKKDTKNLIVFPESQGWFTRDPPKDMGPPFMVRLPILFPYHFGILDWEWWGDHFLHRIDTSFR